MFLLGKGVELDQIEDEKFNVSAGDESIAMPLLIVREDIAMRHETRQHVDEALATLNEKYRVVFVLRDIEELSTRETAEILGLTEEAVKVRLLRARLMLRERPTRLYGDESTLVPPHQSEAWLLTLSAA